MNSLISIASLDVLTCVFKDILGVVVPASVKLTGNRKNESFINVRTVFGMCECFLVEIKVSTLFLELLLDLAKFCS